MNNDPITGKIEQYSSSPSINLAIHPLQWAIWPEYAYLSIVGQRHTNISFLCFTIKFITRQQVIRIPVEPKHPADENIILTAEQLSAKTEKQT